MKKISGIILILSIMFVFSTGWAKSGTPIPVPGLSISEAVKIAQEYFYKKETRVIDGEHFKVKDYILISAQYTNYFNEKYEKEWAWKIEFVHPVQNDHSVIYKVRNNKEIIFLYATE